MNAVNTSQQTLTGLTGKGISYSASNKHYLSYCRTEGEIRTLYYTWQIPNFWMMYHMMFPVDAKQDENLPFNFRLQIDKLSQNLEIYILPLYPLKCTYDVAIIDNSFNLKFNSTCFNNSVLFVECKTEMLIHSIPIKEFIKDKKNLLPNNILTIYFKFTWYTNISQVATCMTVSQSYEELQSNKSDVVAIEKSFVTFVVGDYLLYASKNLVCEKSAILKAMLNRHIEEKNTTNEIEITDMTYDILKLFLLYIEFDFIPNLNICTIEILFELFIAADKYNVEDLKLLCEFQLIKSIDICNYMKFINIAWLDNTKYLKNYVQEFLRIRQKCIFNIEEVVGNEESDEEINTKVPSYVTRYTKNIILSCDTETSSEIISLNRDKNRN